VDNDGNQRSDPINRSKEDESKFHPAYTPKVPIVKTWRGVPMEESRLAVSPDDIEAYFHRLVAIVDGPPAHFVFNVDEMGDQEWADREEKPCYVRSEHTGDEVPFPVPRSGKGITLVACIGVDGSFLKPLIVIHRKKALMPTSP
jgi:hypothetical protein